MKASYISTLLAACFALSACGGPSPFKFQSDPLGSEYQSLKSYDMPADSVELTPTIAVVAEGWPEGQVAYGSFFTFKIEVNDPASTFKTPPVLSEPEYVPTLDSIELNGASAVECKTTARSLGDGKWQFECGFNTKDLTDVGTLLKSEKTVNAIFSISAISPRSGLTTGNMKVTVPVQFVKVQASGKGA